MIIKGVFSVNKGIEAQKSIEDTIYSDGEFYHLGILFEQEPELGEGLSSIDISQYPLEDILDKYNAFISDFYKKENSIANSICKLAIASKEKDCIIEIGLLVGKHIYNSVREYNGKKYSELIIE